MYRIALPLLLSATIFAACRSQPEKISNINNDRYLANVRSFTQFLIDSSEDREHFLLKDSVAPNDLSACLNDTITFSQEERSQIRLLSHHLPFTVWSNEIIPQARLIRSDTIEAAFRKHDGWDYFHRHVGPAYNTIACPLFLRDYTMCICYSDRHCGWLCGEGSLALYQKKGANWVIVRIYDYWIS